MTKHLVWFVITISVGACAFLYDRSNHQHYCATYCNGKCP